MIFGLERYTTFEFTTLMHESRFVPPPSIYPGLTLFYRYNTPCLTAPVGVTISTGVHPEY